MEQSAQTSAYLPRCRLRYSIGRPSVEINGSRLGRLTCPSDRCLMTPSTCARSSAGDRTHCYAIFRIAPALMIGALVLGGWLAGARLAQARGDSQRSATTRTGHSDSLTHPTRSGRHRGRSKAHTPQGRKAACKHERRCAQRHDPPSQPAGGGSSGAPPSGADSSSPPGESLSQALPARGSPPLQAPPTEAPAKEAPATEPPGGEQHATEEAPTSKPPTGEPPVEEPSAQEPPAKEPPANEPPAQAPPTGGTSPSYALRLFSAQSFFNQPLAASTPQASDWLSWWRPSTTRCRPTTGTW